MPRRRKKPVAGPELHRRWRVVLEDAGLKESVWARNRGLTQSHVRQVVLGKRDSEALLLEVVVFIEDRERLLRKRLAANLAA